MPLFEYDCEACGKRSTLLVLKRDEASRLNCKHCGSDRLTRLLSRFAVHKTEASRLSELDTSKQPDETFYRDNRNIGLRAKKRMKELGVDLGDAIDEKIEKARTSTLDTLTED